MKLVKTTNQFVQINIGIPIQGLKKQDVQLDGVAPYNRLHRRKYGLLSSK